MTEPEHHRELFQVQMSQELLSRGTGETVPISEITALDVMPQIIGAAFLTNDDLRAGLHFHGEGYGPALAKEAAYSRLSHEELANGNVTESLAAYRRGLHHAISWVGMVASMGAAQGGRVLLTPRDLQSMNVASRFKPLEGQLSTQLWQSNFSFNPDEYTTFVKETRRLEKRRLQLHQLFFLGESNAYEPLQASQVHDPEIGREYLETCIAMRRFKEASWVSRRLSRPEEEAALLEKAKTEPKDNPRFLTLLRHEVSKIDPY